MEMEEIVEASESNGGHFFDESTMKKFDTKLIDVTFEHVGGDEIFFVTDDRNHDGTERVYKVRVFSKKTKGIWTPYREGQSMSFDNESDALAKAKELAETPDAE